MKKPFLFLILTALISINVFTQQRCNYSDSIFYEKANFVNAKFYCIADFSESYFNQTAKFYTAYFDTNANFQNTYFDTIAIFQSTNFIGEVSFSQAKFNSNADFHLTTYYSAVDFSNVQFDSTVQFISGRFNKAANFMNTSFEDKVDFSHSYFRNKPVFEEVHFYSDVSFKMAEFKTIANFHKTHFHKGADFDFVRFDSIADFSDAKFYSGNLNISFLPKYLDFSNIRIINNDINLTSSKNYPQNDLCRIILINADIDKIKLQYSNFELYFPKDTDPEIKANVYEKLLANQKREGYIISFQKLDKEYREFKYIESGQYGKFEGYLYNWINSRWWDFGYNKLLIVFNTLYIFLFFSFINTIFFKCLVTKVYVIGDIKEWRLSKTRSKFGMFFRNIPYSLFYTAVIFFGLKFDLKKLHYMNNLKDLKILVIFYVFIVYVAGLICLGYLANFVITT